MKGLLFVMLLMKLRIETQAEVFNSIAAMEPIMKTQTRVIRSIEAYLTEEKRKIQFIENHISYSVKKLTKAEKDPKYLWNPINAYSLMNSVARDFSFIRNITKERTGYYKDKTLLYPSMKDLTDSSNAIARLQTVYRLNITQLANGTLVGNYSHSNELFVEHVTPMTSDDCYYMGLVSEVYQGFSGQLLWMREALRKQYAERCDIYCPVKEVAIVLKISEAYENLKEYKKALEWLKRAKTLLPAGEQKEYAKHVQELQVKVDNEEGHKTRREQKKAWKQPRSKYLFGCYEDLKQNISSHKWDLLKCSYEVSSPFLTYAPVKVESLNVAPFVVLYHDVISDAEIEALKDITIPRLEDTFVYSNKSTSKKKSKYRISKGAILDQNWPLVARLTQRIGDISGTNTLSTLIHVINYRIADMYAKHVDYLSYIVNDPRGDRLVAFIYFLSDVTQGGALTFPVLGLKVYPKKGAAVAWMVLYPSGDGNLAMEHISCPVLRGSKWVAVHWSFERDQDNCPYWFDKDGIMTGEKYSYWLRKHKEMEKQSFAYR